MSEYWKSTPKYWCKFCSDYVRDTPLDRRNHESTGRHQGAIQRSLRNIHREHGREEREKQRAKDEVARLKAGSSALGRGGSGSANGARTGGVQAPAPTNGQAQATPQERIRQMQQLADMGVAVPEEFRRDMAMAGEWQTVSRRHVTAEQESVVPASARSVGVRKRKVEDGESEDEEETKYEGAQGELRPKKNKLWGSAFKSHPGSKGETMEDFDALLGGASTSNSLATMKPEPDTKVTQEEDHPRVKPEEGEGPAKNEDDARAERPKDEPDMKFKREDEDHGRSIADLAPAEPTSNVVFKKRKKKA